MPVRFRPRAGWFEWQPADRRTVLGSVVTFLLALLLLGFLLAGLLLK
jgi:hypothetical protein